MILTLIVGDLIALGLFVFLGQQEHDLVDPANPFVRLFITAGELGVVWLVAGALLGAFPRSPVAARALLGRSLNAWLVAAPLAVLLRAFILGRAVIPTVFLALTVLLGGLFLLAWRMLFLLVRRSLTRR